MTVVMCDLVRSSTLAAQLDPEDFAALLVSYRERCASAVTRYGGYISRYVGDGVLACFGYPRAIGRDAHSAVSCALAITREIIDLANTTSLPGGNNVAVRVGVETGVVVAGPLGQKGFVELDDLVGTAPNTAARLQELAPPNGVVIGEATYELVTEDFHFEELPRQRLARLEPPVRAFVVKDQVARRGRRLVLSRRHVPIVGRHDELKLILQSWALASQGKGQTVLLSGEAGIGKSRLAQELLDHIAIQPHALILLNCTPLSIGTALHPVIKALGDELASLAQNSSGAVTPLQALTSLVEALGLAGDDTLAVLARALELGPDLTELAAAASRRLLFNALQAWLLHRAREQTVMIVVEDLHWSDPSLLELLRELIDIIPSRRAMLLATYRSELTLPWPDRPTTLRITLPPLDRLDAERLLNSLQSGAQSAETRAAILTRADGVPLFLEEFALSAGTPAIPRSLQQLFTARLDALEDSKWIAQCAAILAPLLDLDLLAALAGFPDDIVDKGLRRLVDVEVLARVSGATGAAGYTFRHALLQDAAIQSLLGADRRELHARAASLLARLRPKLVEQQPEALADHYASGGKFAAAAQLYASAARRALRTAALEEAESHARRGLSATEAASPAEVTQIDLDLRVLLGNVLIAKRGYANVSVQLAFEEALKAAERVREEAHALPALRGLASFYQVRGPLSHAALICDRLVAAAETTQDACLLCDAWRRRGWNRGCMGQLIAAEQDLKRALNAFDAERVEEHIAIAGHDPKVLALANLCWIAPSRYGSAVAVERADAAATTAQNSPHPVSACYGLVFSALILQKAGQFEKAKQSAVMALAIANQKGLAYWVAMARVAIGYDKVVRCGDLVAGRETIRLAMADYRETQGELLRPFILSLLAEIEAVLGETDAAQALLQEAIELAESLEAHIFLPELLLHKARLPGRKAAPTLRREHLQRALKIARAQGADVIAGAADEELRAV